MVADVILAANDPRVVVSPIELSRANYRKMAQNLAWAGGYNLIAMPLAAGVWSGSVSRCLRRSVRRIDLRPSTLEEGLPTR